MEADGESEVQKKSRFRWIDAARYGVASVVAVLIISVIVNAIEVVLRPESLSLSVIGGAVFAQPQTQPPPPVPTLLFHLDLRARNPSGRARMYYLNITVYLFDNTTSPLSPRPGPDSIMYFYMMKDKALDQLGKVDMLREVNETRGRHGIPDSWFDMLYGRTGAAIGDVTMRVDGVVVTELRSGFNVTRRTTYLCQPLVVVAGDRDDEAYQNLQDVRCMEQASNVL